MPCKLDKSRLQYGLFATPLEEMMEADNVVRIIDAFVDTLDVVNYHNHFEALPGAALEKLTYCWKLD